VLAVLAVLFVDVVAFSPDMPPLLPARDRRGVATSAGDLRGDIGDAGGGSGGVGTGGGGAVSAMVRDLSEIMSGSVVLIVAYLFYCIIVCCLFFGDVDRCSARRTTHAATATTATEIMWSIENGGFYFTTRQRLGKWQCAWSSLSFAGKQGMSWACQEKCDLS